MGLDIIAFEKIEFLCADPDSADSPYDVDDESFAHLYPNDDFPSRADALVRGVYRSTGKRMEFRAGSYSGYSAWREALARLVGTTAERVFAGTVPPAFGELIDFADNEGLIGPQTSAKLAKDFASWKARAATHAKTMRAAEGAAFMEGYASFQEAFELAANGGAIQFC